MHSYMLSEFYKLRIVYELKMAYLSWRISLWRSSLAFVNLPKCYSITFNRLLKLMFLFVNETDFWLYQHHQ